MSRLRLQPVFIDFDVDRICRLPPIVGPDVALAEAHPIERLQRQARSRVGEFLWIAKCAAKAFDDAGLAANVKRCANVP
jgi:hypothetical protein